MTAASAAASTTFEGSVVVVAKCPIPGKSKTRLIPLLGEEGSAALARAMLSDVLTALSSSSSSAAFTTSGDDKIQRVLLYAPPNQDGKDQMESILEELALRCEWQLLPMHQQEQSSRRQQQASESNQQQQQQQQHNLQSSDLGSILTNALLRVREMQKVDAIDGPVIFFGMDAPEVPLDEVDAALQQEQDDAAAILCPASDGGYGMLSVPRHLTEDAERVFAGVRWSHPLTGLCQLKALTDMNCTKIRVGRLMHDIDEPNDVHALCARLQHTTKEQSSGSSAADAEDCLTRSSNMSSSPPRTGDCRHTREALRRLGLLLLTE